MTKRLGPRLRGRRCSGSGRPARGRGDERPTDPSQLEYTAPLVVSHRRGHERIAVCVRRRFPGGRRRAGARRRARGRGRDRRDRARRLGAPLLHEPAAQRGEESRGLRAGAYRGHLLPRRPRLRGEARRGGARAAQPAHGSLDRAPRGSIRRPLRAEACRPSRARARPTRAERRNRRSRGRFFEALRERLDARA
jgi:hypothetical protein